PRKCRRHDRYRMYQRLPIRDFPGCGADRGARLAAEWNRTPRVVSARIGMARPRLLLDLSRSLGNADHRHANPPEGLRAAFGVAGGNLGDRLSCDDSSSIRDGLALRRNAGAPRYPRRLAPLRRTLAQQSYRMKTPLPCASSS